MWKNSYRAVDKYGQTMDFLLTEHRDTQAALKFLKQAICGHGVPETITIDGSEANEAASKRYNQEHGTHIAIQQVNICIISWNKTTEPSNASRVPCWGSRRLRRLKTRWQYRTQAHDQETTAGGQGERQGPHCGRTVLLAGRVIPPTNWLDSPHINFTRKFATELDSGLMEGAESYRE